MRLIDADALHDWLKSYAKHGIDDHLRANAKQLMKHVDEQPTVLDTPTEEQFAACSAELAALKTDLFVVQRNYDEARMMGYQMQNKLTEAEAELAALKDENERLKCCGNCGHWINSYPRGRYCHAHRDGKQTWGHDSCYLKPSRWAERGTE